MPRRSLLLPFLLISGSLLAACGPQESSGPQESLPPLTVPAQRPEPGSVESVRQELSAECTDAVQGLRGLMERFDRVEDVPYDGSYDAAYQEAKAGCDAEEFRRFYLLELTGWIYG